MASDPSTAVVTVDASTPAPRSDTEARHMGACSVCRHPDRREIEALYAGWADPRLLAEAYGLTVRALRRHVAIFGLGRVRNRNIAAGLGRLIERALRQLDSRDYEVSVEELLALVREVRELQGAERMAQARGEHADTGEKETWEALVLRGRRG